MANVQEAIIDSMRALRILPDDAEIFKLSVSSYFSIGYSKARQSDFNGAIKGCSLSLKYNDQDASTYISLAKAFQQIQVNIVFVV